MKPEIIEILAASGVKGKKAEDIVSALEALIKTSRPAGGAHAPYTEDGVTYIWCSRHQEYHKAEVMVPNKSKESGYANYCKAAQRRWEWMHKHSQLLTSVIARLYKDGKNDDASKLYFLSETLKTEKNNQPTMYSDIDIDMSGEEVVESCKTRWYTDDIIELIPADMHKMLGLAAKPSK